MSDTFFRFPHTPHLKWLGEGLPRDDKVLPASEARTLLAGDVVVEEKIDGANLGFSLDESGQLRAQNRGQYVEPPYAGQFSKLSQWIAIHGDTLSRTLNPEWIVFGEWCAARHSLNYDRLPDWWLLFDVYDRRRRQFQSTTVRDAFAARAGLATVTALYRGRITLRSLEALLMDSPSRYRTGPLEGLVVRSEAGDALQARAKLVRPDFTQAIDQHWRNRRLEWNRLGTAESVSRPASRPAG